MQSNETIPEVQVTAENARELLRAHVLRIIKETGKPMWRIAQDMSMMAPKLTRLLKEERVLRWQSVEEIKNILRPKVESK